MKPREEHGSSLAKVEGFFEPLTKTGQGNRQEREPFMFRPRRDSFYIAAGACVTSGRQFFGGHIPE
jgi:hypothetical protein